MQARIQNTPGKQPSVTSLFVVSAFQQSCIFSFQTHTPKLTLWLDQESQQHPQVIRWEIIMDSEISCIASRYILPTICGYLRFCNGKNMFVLCMWGLTNQGVCGMVSLFLKKSHDSNEQSWFDLSNDLSYRTVNKHWKVSQGMEEPMSQWKVAILLCIKIINQQAAQPNHAIFPANNLTIWTRETITTFQEQNVTDRCT